MGRAACHNGPGPESSRSRVLALLGWLFAIGLSLGLNLFLFGIMPGLIHSVPQRPDALEDIRTVQVVRVKRPDTPPKKREKTKPPKPEDKPKPVKQLARMTAPQPAPIRPKLPFELNPKLPRFSDSLEMPPLSHFTMKAAAPKGLYQMGDLDSPLMPVNMTQPPFPLRASRLGIEGWVKVGFVVTRAGQVEDIKILGAQPQGVFENTVINHISQWRFKPGTVEGVAVATQAQTTIRFQLDQ
ncbi:MAG: energy transducer TonB [Desulfobacter sp.]|nr:MAG: energy transducer TonB [Desulfobacter sp.]